MKPRPAAALPESLDRQLNSYSLAAISSGAGFDKNLLAAGVVIATAGFSMLAATPIAEAKIVYTPAHVTLRYGYTPLDLNHDGVNDFLFAIHTSFRGSHGGSMLSVGGSASNSVVVRNGYVAALRAGVRVGGKGKLPPKIAGVLMAGRAWGCVSRNTCTTVFAGPWENGGKGVKDRYLGLKFTIKGKIHYGWARLKIGPDSVGGVLTGYAYETIPNKAIITGKTTGAEETSADPSNPEALSKASPEPATLGLLAMGTVRAVGVAPGGVSR